MKVQRKNNKFVLNTVIELVAKVERRPRKGWVTPKMIKNRRKKEMEEC